MSLLTCSGVEGPLAASAQKGDHTVTCGVRGELQSEGLVPGFGYYGLFSEFSEPTDVVLTVVGKFHLPTKGVELRVSGVGVGSHEG